MKLLIPVFSPATGTWGGLTRVVALAQAAQVAGHQIAFCAAGGLATSLRRQGYQVYATPAPTFLGLSPALSRVIERRSQRTTLPVPPGRDFGSIWLVLVISGMARAGYLRRLVEVEIHAVRDFGAEALFTDLDLATFLVAQIAGLPVAAAYQSPMAQGVGSLPWKLLNRSIGSVQRQYRLQAQCVDLLCHGPEVLKLIPSIPELESIDPQRPDVCYVGPLLGEIQPGTFQPEAGKRYVFVYMGTGSLSLDTLRAVLPQVFEEAGPYRCLVGAQSIQTTERIGGVEFQPYLPAAAVLPHCDWTICHGGQNTIIQSLLNGVPLLVFPGPIFERRYNARQVQAAGAGHMGELPDFTAEQLRRLVASHDACQRGARTLGAGIRASGGPQAAISAIEAYASRSLQKEPA